MNEKIYPKYRWYVLFALLVSTIIQGMVLICPSPIVGGIAESLKTDLGVVTAAVTLPFLLMISVGGILSGFILDKFGLEKTFIASTAIIVITALLMPVFGKTLLGLVVLRGIQGLSFAPTTAAGPRVAAEWFPINQRVMVPSLTNAALSLGISIGFSVSPAIAASAGWNVAITSITIVMIVSLILFVVQAFGPKSPGSIEENMTVAAGDDDFKKVFGLSTFWMTLIAFFMLAWVQQGYNNLLPGNLAIPAPVGLGLGEQVTGGIMSAYTITVVIGAILSGFIVEKIFGGKFKTGVTVSFTFAAIFCTLAMLPAVYTNVKVLTGCVMLAGFFMGMPGPLTQGFIASNYPAHITGRVGGITIGLGMFGGTVSLAACSFALHATGFYTIPIAIIICAAIIGAIAGFGIKPLKIFENKKDVNVNL